MKAKYRGGLAGILVWVVIFVYGLVYCFGFTCSDVGCLPCVVLESIPSNPDLLAIIFSTLFLSFVVGFLTGWVVGEVKEKRKWKRVGLRTNEGLV